MANHLSYSIFRITQKKIAQYMHEKVVHILSYLLYSIDLFIMVQSGLLD
jgi:hypothetical protein